MLASLIGLRSLHVYLLLDNPISWNALAMIDEITPKGYHVTFLSAAADGLRQSGDRSGTLFRREQLKQLAPHADFGEYCNYFNRLAALRRPLSTQPKGPNKDGSWDMDYLIGWRASREAPLFLVKWSGFPFSASTWQTLYVRNFWQLTVSFKLGAILTPGRVFLTVPKFQSSKQLF